MKAQVDHIERPLPPWRTERATECGLDGGHQMISRAEFYERVVDLGKQRAAMTLCMTCWSTAERHVEYRHQTRAAMLAAFLAAWDDDPVGVLARDLYGKRRELLAKELRVVGMLVEAHRDEFDEAMAGLDEAASLAERRADKAVASMRGRRRR